MNGIEQWKDILREGDIEVSVGLPNRISSGGGKFYSYTGIFEWRCELGLYSFKVKEICYGLSSAEDEIVDECIDNSPDIKDRLISLVDEWKRINSL